MGQANTRVDPSHPVPWVRPKHVMRESVPRYRGIHPTVWARPSPGFGHPSTCLDTSMAMYGCIQLLVCVHPNPGLRASVRARGSCQARVRMHPSHGMGVPKTVHGRIQKGCSNSPRQGLASPIPGVGYSQGACWIQPRRVLDAAKAHDGAIRTRRCAHPRSITAAPVTTFGCLQSAGRFIPYPWTDRPHQCPGPGQDRARLPPRGRRRARQGVLCPCTPAPAPTSNQVLEPHIPGYTAGFPAETLASPCGARSEGSSPAPETSR
jgi:hypothetical protein